VYTLANLLSLTLSITAYVLYGRTLIGPYIG
jgi:hypothetical protein